MTIFKDILQFTYQLLLPTKCLICGKRVWQVPLCSFCSPQKPINVSRCPKCFSPTPDNKLCMGCKIYKSPFRISRYLWNYSDTACQLVKAMKYAPSPNLCKIAGSYLAASLDTLNIYPEDFDIVIPIPSSNRNLNKRGFNQCSIIAKCISDKLNRGIVYKALVHIKDIPSQATLSHSQRFKNIKNAFSADPLKIKNKRILLVDDVVTTGATSYTAAETLLEAGAKSVSLISLLRSDNWQHYRNYL